MSEQQIDFANEDYELMAEAARRISEIVDSGVEAEDVFKIIGVNSRAITRTALGDLQVFGGGRRGHLGHTYIVSHRTY